MLTITLSEASDLIARTKAATENGNLLDLTMPNGKLLGDCTGEEISQIAQAMQELARLMS